jgi:carbonic anhydrase/acetyltransferase-like protein (isoleucine patch superfamily)
MLILTNDFGLNNDFNEYLDINNITYEIVHVKDVHQIINDKRKVFVSIQNDHLHDWVATNKLIKLVRKTNLQLCNVIDESVSEDVIINGVNCFIGRGVIGGKIIIDGDNVFIASGFVVSGMLQCVSNSYISKGCILTGKNLIDNSYIAAGVEITNCEMKGFYVLERNQKISGKYLENVTLVTECCIFSNYFQSV